MDRCEGTGRVHGWRPIRWTAVAGLTAVLAVAMAGCQTGGEPERDGDGQRRREAIAAEIQDTLARRPDVVQVRAYYIDDITDPGSAGASIQVTAGAEFGPIRDEAVRLIWRSRLAPLSNIRVAVADVDDNRRNEIQHFDTDGTDKAILEGKYGPRPG